MLYNHTKLFVSKNEFQGIKEKLKFFLQNQDINIHDHATLVAIEIGLRFPILVKADNKIVHLICCEYASGRGLSLLAPFTLGFQDQMSTESEQWFANPLGKSKLCQNTGKRANKCPHESTRSISQQVNKFSSSEFKCPHNRNCYIISCLSEHKLSLRLILHRQFICHLVIFNQGEFPILINKQCLYGVASLLTSRK